jgi:transcriptional repressor NrdR
MPKEPGLRCPKCNNKTRVTDSRPLNRNQKIRRRRECVKCKERFTTYEFVYCKNRIDIPCAHRVPRHESKETTNYDFVKRALNSNN